MNITRNATVLVVLLAGVLLIYSYGTFHATAQPPAPPPTVTTVPAFKHVFVIVLENRSYNEVIDNTTTAYLNELAQQYALAENYYGVTHPSLPNYLAMIGGDTFGITQNCTDCFVDAPNLVDQLETGGKSWKAYMESMPESCFVGDDAPLYRQKHNPFIYFDDIRNDPARCQKIVPFTQFASDLQADAVPDFVWITPDMCNDGHDCPLSATDAWLHQWVPAITESAAWRDDGVLFITFDEGQRSDTGSCCEHAQGGRIATLVISPLAHPGFTSQVAYDHYSLLHTIEAAWGLPALGKADCACSPVLGDFFVTAADHSDHSVAVPLVQKYQPRLERQTAVAPITPARR